MKIQEVLWKLNSRKAIKRFNCIKTCNKKVGRSKWFIKTLMLSADLFLDSAIESNSDNSINNNKTITSKYLEYKIKIIGRTPDNLIDAEIVVPLKYLSNIWRFLDLSLINCELELDLSWSKIA